MEQCTTSEIPFFTSKLKLKQEKFNLLPTYQNTGINYNPRLESLVLGEKWNASPVIERNNRYSGTKKIRNELVSKRLTHFTPVFHFYTF